ncbi:hypothetical protein RKQ67_19180 (plasmid) [Acinetobacter baumannii]
MEAHLGSCQFRIALILMKRTVALKQAVEAGEIYHPPRQLFTFNR